MDILVITGIFATIMMGILIGLLYLKAEEEEDFDEEDLDE